MHTMKKHGDHWTVGSLERDAHGDSFVPMFSGLDLVAALRLTSMLNGGEAVSETLLSESALKLSWRRAHGV